MVPKNQIGTIRNVPEEALRLRIIGRLAIRLRTMTGERSALSRGCATVRKSENEGAVLRNKILALVSLAMCSFSVDAEVYTIKKNDCYRRDGLDG
jgi:hypothetical protein